MLSFLASVRDRVLKNAALSEGKALLNHSQALAEEAGVLDRCRFLRAPATDLSALEHASVNAVTARSVPVYVEDKKRAFEEFHRVLKPGGRL